MPFFDRRADQIAPLGPGPIVVNDIVDAQQILQHEPCMAGALAYSAIRNHRLGLDTTLGAVYLLEFVGRLEGSIVIAGFAPRHAARTGNVTAALAGFGQSR